MKTLAERLRHHAETELLAAPVVIDLFKAADELEAEAWIPVTEAMPEEGEWVLTWTTMDSHWSMVRKDGLWVDHEGIDRPADEITHWRHVKGPQDVKP